MSHVTQVSCIPHTTSSAWAPKAHKQSHSVPARFKHHYPHGRPRRLDNRNSVALKLHEQPFRGEFSCQREQSIKLA